MAAAGVADGQEAGILQHKGNSGAAQTSSTASTDQQEDSGRCPGYLQFVHCPQHSTGLGSVNVQPSSAVDTMRC